MNATLKSYKMEIYRPNWKKPACVSVLLHICVFTLATLGLPYFTTTPEPEDVIIAVEMVDIAEFAQTDNLDEPDKSEEEDTPAPPPKPVYNNTDTVPDLLSPKEPDITPEPVEEVEEIPEPPKEDEPKIDITEIKEPPKPKNKPKPKPKPPEPKAEPAKEQPDFTSLLKSLTPDEPTESVQKPKENDGAGRTSQIADFDKQMTRSELDDLNRGVQPCWNVQAGGRDAQTLVVKLRVFVRPDLTVRDVEILDQPRYDRDSHFKAAADAAKWALLMPKCNTLRIPPEKYESYKSFIYNFDPSNML